MGKSVVIVNTSAGAMGGGPTGVWLSELADPQQPTSSLVDWRISTKGRDDAN